MSELADALGTAILRGAPADDPLALVRRVAEAEGEVRILLQQAVAAARARGASWGDVGACLGMSRQAAQQRFGRADDAGPTVDSPVDSPVDSQTETRWLGPVTAFDEMRELDLAGLLGWRTIGAGLLGHRLERTSRQWEHRRVLWTAAQRHLSQGWQIGARAFPWVYLVRETERTALEVLPAAHAGDPSTRG